jgi:hypothetical protein
MQTTTTTSQGPQTLKISATPTKTIAIAARTQSEWDRVDFAIVNLNDNWIILLSERMECIKLVKDSSCFQNIQWDDNPDAWHMFGGINQVWEETGLTDELEAELQKSEWVYVEDITEDQADNLMIPEQRIDGESVSINGNFSLQFRGYGKHTSEEFWTSAIPMQTIIDNYNAMPKE